jgi:hypothetical protein
VYTPLREPYCVVCWFCNSPPLSAHAHFVINGHSTCAAHVAVASHSNNFTEVVKRYCEVKGLDVDRVLSHMLNAQTFLKYVK